DFVGADVHAAARQEPRADLLDQERIVLGVAIEGPVADGLDAQRLARAFAPLTDGKEGRIDLAIDEGVGISLPVARLDDIALAGGAQLRPPRPWGCCCF